MKLPNYYIPVVAKNRDQLVGYISGYRKAIEQSEVFLGLIAKRPVSIVKLDDPVAMGLDSFRYNNIRSDGCLESDVDDLFSYSDMFASLDDNDELDNDIADVGVLTVECRCGFGIYTFRSTEEIPVDDFCCVECGKKLILYTSIEDIVEVEELECIQ